MNKFINENFNHFKIMAESTFEAIGIHQNGVLLDANTQYFKMFGYEREELIGKNVIPLTVAPVSIERLQRRILSKSTNRYEAIGLRKDGSTFPIEVNVRHIKYKGETVRVGVIRDTTHRKKVEDALRESEKKYRFLAENITDVIWTMDMNLRYNYFSPSIERLQGYTQEEAMNLSLEQRLTPASFEKAIKIFNSELSKFNKKKKAPKIPIKAEFEVKSKDGSITPVEIEANYIIGRDGRPEGVIGVTRDITERKKAEKALLRAHKQLDLRVKERTKELEKQRTRLEEVNTALNVMLKKREEDKQILEEKVLFNVKELIEPLITNLKNSGLDDNQKAYVDTLERFLKEIVSPFSRTLHDKFRNLTLSEIRVANLIKDGKTTKEIAGLLNSTPRAVEFHRQNIRKKLGLRKRKANLGSHLLALLK